MPADAELGDRRDYPLPDRANERAILAIQEDLAAPGPSARLGKLLAEHEAVSRPRQGLSEAVRASVKEFERDCAELSRQVSTEVDQLNSKWGAQFDRVPPVQRAQLNVFSPDTAGTQGPHQYRFGWVYLDWGEAAADPRTGKFFASNYTTGGQRWTVAQIGAQFTPTQPWSRLAVRPYVRWSGFDTLTHRVHDESIPEQRWATALGSVGILVQSWDSSGGGFYVDAEHYVDVWVRNEPNPSGSREYADVAYSGSGVYVEPLVTSARNYTIWICCRVMVAADPGFAISTYASSSISCEVPYFVVEELPL
jgi:hypothetical protein